MARFLTQRIAVNELQNNALYHIAARNSCAGIYCSRTRSFQIARSKYRQNFLFREFDWDIGPPHGTAVPRQMIELAPNFADDHQQLLYLLRWRAFLAEEGEDYEGDWISILKLSR